MKNIAAIALAFLLAVLPIFSSSEEPAPEIQFSPVGMWSFYWDARQLNKTLGKNKMSFEIQAYSLYLLDNGSAYMQQANVKTDGSDFSPLLLSGIWIGDASDMTIRVGESTFKAWIDSTGKLYLKMTDDMATVFQHIENFDYNEGMLNKTKKSGSSTPQEASDSLSQETPATDSFHAAADKYEGYKLKKGKGYLIGEDLPEGYYMIEYAFEFGRFYIYSSEKNFKKEIAESTELVGTPTVKNMVTTNTFQPDRSLK